MHISISQSILHIVLYFHWVYIPYIFAGEHDLQFHSITSILPSLFTPFSRRWLFLEEKLVMFAHFWLSFVTGMYRTLCLLLIVCCHMISLFPVTLYNYSFASFPLVVPTIILVKLGIRMLCSLRCSWMLLSNV